MDAYFFRVDHDLLRSDSFKTLGGSAIKVYLILGLYSNFGTGWAFPSVRTIAKQAGLSRQTVLTALAELAKAGLVATQKATGKSNAYKILRQPPARPKAPRADAPKKQSTTRPNFSEAPPRTGRISLDLEGSGGPDTLEALAQFFGAGGLKTGREQEIGNENNDNPESATIPIPGTPFRLAPDGRLHVAVDLQQLLTGEGLPKRTAERLLAQKDPEDVAKVLLNAFYLKSQGKLQNSPGYIRAGIEEGYELLPPVAKRLASKLRELKADQAAEQSRRRRQTESEAAQEEEAAIALVISRLRPSELERLIQQAVDALPKPISRHNPTITNPFIRAKIYELACGEPAE